MEPDTAAQAADRPAPLTENPSAPGHGATPPSDTGEAVLRISAAAFPPGVPHPSTAEASPPSGLTRARALPRRSVLVAAALGLGLTAGGTLATRKLLPTAPDTLAERPLHSLTVAFTSADARGPVSAPDQVIPGTRVQAHAENAHLLVRREEDWLDSLAPWTRTSPHADLIRNAYLDLFVLTEGLPATAAGWTSAWRHIWPRDTAHAAAAFAAAGDLPRADALLEHLAAAPRTEAGWFEARYDIRGGGAPDDRSPQFDGLGWAAWALGWIHENAVLDVTERASFVRRHAAFASSLATSMLAALNPRSGGPPVSSDYWEVFEWRVTLGIAAPTLAGLQRLQPVLAAADDPLARKCAVAEAALTEYIRERFAEHGFPRHAHGRHADSAVGFMLPPYLASWPDPENARRALAETEARLLQPAGGITPGERWADDGVSWTPETAVFALANATSAEAAHRARAARQLEWLAAHRTPAGSFPEKVLASGEPSAVAPLAWTAACAALAAHALTRAGDSRTGDGMRARSQR
ncbi:hypothetical protein [Brevibacterium salitolerans]|uniref:Glycoside hydrolase family 15 n=1 Tax=Brevibacterium salitolerans TaxID=1403566 RepID=A0ABN2WV25_9MICO